MNSQRPRQNAQGLMWVCTSLGPRVESSGHMRPPHPKAMSNRYPNENLVSSKRVSLEEKTKTNKKLLFWVGCMLGNRWPTENQLNGITRGSLSHNVTSGLFLSFYIMTFLIFLKDWFIYYIYFNMRHCDHNFCSLRYNCKININLLQIGWFLLQHTFPTLFSLNEITFSLTRNYFISSLWCVQFASTATLPI